MQELNTIEDYRQELETQKKLVAALLEGQPSGLNVHQARILMGNLEKENQALRGAVRVLSDKLMSQAGAICSWADGGPYYCDNCPLAWLDIAGRNCACGKTKKFSK